MTRKNPHALEPGETLAEDVFNLDGNLLFSQGKILTGKRIETLMMWGISSVAVTGGADAKPQVDLSSFSQKAIRQAEKRIEERYRLNKSSHPAVELIRRISVQATAQLGKRANRQP